MGLYKYYTVLLIEIVCILYLYMIEGYNFSYPFFNIFYGSLLLLLFIKINIILLIIYINKYTRLFINRYYYMLLKIYTIIVVYITIKSII